MRPARSFPRSFIGLIGIASVLSCGAGSRADRPNAEDGAAGASVGGSGGGAGRGGTSPGGSGGSGGAGLQDAGSSDAGFAAEFAERVRAAVAQGGTPSTCASPLPPIPVASAEEARAAVGAFIAQALAVVPTSLTATMVSCGSQTTASCARTFQHDIYKSNGIYGESLYPLAEELEARAIFVEETIWTAPDGSSEASVCISGVVDGLLVGVVMFNGRQTCPP